AFIEDELHPGSEATPITLKHKPVVKSARNRVSHHIDATGITRTLKLLYDGGPAPAAGQVQIDRTTGQLTFGDAPVAADKVTVSYAVARANAVKVTLRLEEEAEEVYTVVDGNDLADDINRRSALVTAAPDATHGGELPAKSVPPDAFASLKGGQNGEDAASSDYKSGLDLLLNEDAHIIVAAGQDDSFGDELDAHCQQASTDLIKHDRIALVGSKLGATLD